MRNALQSTVALVAMALGVVALWLMFYEVHDSRPYLPRIEAIYASMDPDDRKPPDNVQSFVWKVDARAVNFYTPEALLSELRGPMRMSAWHYDFVYAGWMLTLAPQQIAEVGALLPLLAIRRWQRVHQCCELLLR